MDVNKRLELIKRNIQEIIGEDELKELLKGKKKPVIYWGTMPTGSISIAYFFPMLKIADFLRAGCEVKILLADLHAALDGVPWADVDKRYDYYKAAIILILKTIGVKINKLEFVKGSEMQLKPEYMYDILQLSSMTSVHGATRAASEAVKSAKGSNIKVSGLIYPLMQALDEQYLGVDIQFAGVDQRKIMVYAREFLPKIGYNARIELMSPMIRGLVGKQMSSSIEATKIDLMDNEETVKKKLNKADFVEGNIDNGVMALLKYFIFIVKKDNGESLIIERPERFGGTKEYSNYESLEGDVLAKELHPMDVKKVVAKEINILLSNFRNNKDLIKKHDMAYGIK